VLGEGVSTRQDPSSALGKAQHSLGLRRASRTGLNPPGKIIRNNSEAAPNRAKEPSLRRIGVNAEAQAPEEAAGATIATAKMIRVPGRPTGTGQAADSAEDRGAARATGGAETRLTEEVAVQEERHHHPRRQEAEAELEPVGRR